MLEIHTNIIEKLDYFLKIKKIPNILFHGPSGSGKRTLVYAFIDKIYNNDKLLKQNYVIFVNCAQGKGIKFIREELKFFAKTHINFQNGDLFKTIILSNADKLTIDAQSALRRCIELFSHTTRFFIIVEDKYKLLRPIMSRFSEIYIPQPYINNKPINLYKYNLHNLDNLHNLNNLDNLHNLDNLDNLNNLHNLHNLNSLDNTKNNTLFYLKKHLINLDTNVKICEMTEKLYDKGITGLDLVDYIIITYKENIEKYKLLLIIQKIKRELRNEKIIILFILNLIFFRSESDLENILCM